MPTDKQQASKATDASATDASATDASATPVARKNAAELMALIGGSGLPRSLGRIDRNLPRSSHRSTRPAPLYVPDPDTLAMIQTLESAVNTITGEDAPDLVWDYATACQLYSKPKDVSVGGFRKRDATRIVFGLITGNLETENGIVPLPENLIDGASVYYVAWVLSNYPEVVLQQRYLQSLPNLIAQIRKMGYSITLRENGDLKVV